MNRPIGVTRSGGVSPREILLDAAAAEFWIHGLAGTRIQDILDRATASRTSLYHHFAGKGEIADALIAERRWQDMVAEHRRLELRGLPSLGAFWSAIAQRVGVDVRARALVRIAHELEDPATESGIGDWHAFTVTALEEAQTDGAVSREGIAGAAESLVESLCGTILNPVSRDPLIERVAVQWRLAERALRAP